MRQKTYSLTAMVLRTTKLGETDLIATMLASDGQLAKGVAKGARKPGSRFGAAFEPGRVVDLLLSRGRGLDTITEARRSQRGDEATQPAVPSDLEHTSGLAVMCDLLTRVALPGQEAPRLFALSRVAVEALARANAADVSLVAAAHLLKVVSMAGFRPSLSNCCLCGEPAWGASPADEAASHAFSFEEGGVLCSDCAPCASASHLPDWLISLVGTCIASTFAELDGVHIDASAQDALLRFCEDWLRAHMDVSMRSLSFMRSCGVCA